MNRGSRLPRTYGPPVPTLAPPVHAPIVRPFSYAGSPFAAGRHRGVDLGAPPGARVVAPCTGRVAYAGPSPGGGVVSLVCGGRRVTVLPVGQAWAARGRRVERGAPLGRAARGHGGLHLSVRAVGDRLAYVDPAPLLRARARGPLGPAPPPGETRAPHAMPPAAAAADRTRVAPSAAASRGGTRATVAPWPAWLGATLATLAAAGGARIRWRRPGSNPARARTARRAAHDQDG